MARFHFSRPARLVASIVVFVVLFTIIGAKELRSARSAADMPDDGLVRMETQFEELFAQEGPAVLVLFSRGEACCAGAEMMYDDMERSAKRLVEILEARVPVLYVYANDLYNRDDRGFVYAFVREHGIQGLSTVVVFDEDDAMVEQHMIGYNSESLAQSILERTDA